MGISQSELSKIEKGQRKLESLTLEKLAKLYNKEVTFFISDKDTKGVPEQPEVNYWVFKSVADADRSYKSIEGYPDELHNKYVYDSNVANSKQVKTGDIAVIVDKEKVLGFVKISRIAENPDTKTIRRCPECGSTNYEERKTLSPPFKCNRGHVFFKPDSKEVAITKYQAFYGTSYVAPEKKIPVSDLRPYFNRNYNRNMSIQSLANDFFKSFTSVQKLLSTHVTYPGPLDSMAAEDESHKYQPNFEDEREVINRQIKARRGGEKFRKHLLEKYNNTCVVTGCNIVSILEAAHIRPYRGLNDNHISNGLLLRSDIHTLFDLDLIGINPETLNIDVNNELMKDGYELLNGKSLMGSNIKNFVSREALVYRWKLYLANI